MRGRHRHRQGERPRDAPPEGGRIFLVGNPNVGKSVIFSHLTGKYTTASNYPGTTVEISRGYLGGRHQREVVDTPGINSLIPRSEDEKVTRDMILSDPEAVVVQVADAKNLFRALIITSQLAEIRRRTVLVLNMMDEARQRGFDIDTSGLSERLGIEIIETVAVEKRGLSRISPALTGARVPSARVEYPRRLRKAIEETEKEISGINPHGIFGALSLMSGDSGILSTGDPGRLERALRSVGEREEEFFEPFAYKIATARKDWAQRVIAGSVIRGDREQAKGRGRLGALIPAAALAAGTAISYAVLGAGRLADAGLHPTLPLLLAMIIGIHAAGRIRIERWTLRPVSGTLILGLTLYIVYMLVGVFAAGSLVDLLESRVFGIYVIPAVDRLVPGGFLEDLLVGEYGLISMGLSYSISIVLPIVVVFFLVFGVLEDSGYFPRLTVLTNNLLKSVGLSGKATLPVVLGFGCVTMAVLSSRILESRRERIITIALLSLAIPCSAQLGVIMALLSAVSAAGVAVIAGIIILEFVLAGRLLSRIVRGTPTDFMIELPPMRVPRTGNILLKTRARALWFLKEALPFFIAATVVLFILDRTGGMEAVHRTVEPVVGRFLGLPMETTSAFIVGFFRRDYGAAGLYDLWRGGLLDGNQMVVALVVMSLFVPCLATVVVTVKELGVRTAAAIFAFVLALSVLTGGLLNLLLRLSGVSL